ncbi:MAG: hypothetical protein GY925_12350 [Actinomycetia bacterium]|nr:hypothetical protein [Actinomycetes bacterium]
MKRWISTLLVLALVLAGTTSAAAAADRFSEWTVVQDPAMTVVPGSSSEVFHSELFGTTLTTWQSGLDRWIRHDPAGSLGSIPVMLPAGMSVNSAVATGLSSWRVGLSGSAPGLYSFDGTSVTLIETGSLQPVSEHLPELTVLSKGSSDYEFVFVDDVGTQSPTGVEMDGIDPYVGLTGGLAVVRDGGVEFWNDTLTTSNLVAAPFLAWGLVEWSGGVLGKVGDATYAHVHPDGDVVEYAVPGLEFTTRHAVVDDDSFFVYSRSPSWRVWSDGHVEPLYFEDAFGEGDVDAVWIDDAGTEVVLATGSRRANVELPDRTPTADRMPVFSTSRNPGGSSFGDLDGSMHSFEVQMNPNPQYVQWSPNLRYVLSVSGLDGAFVVDLIDDTIVGPIVVPEPIERASWDAATEQFVATPRDIGDIPWVYRIGVDGSLQTSLAYSLGTGEVLPGLTPAGDLMVTRGFPEGSLLQRVDDGSSVPLPDGLFQGDAQDRVRGLHLIGMYTSVGVRLITVSDTPAIVDTIDIAPLPGESLWDVDAVEVDELAGVGIVVWRESANRIPWASTNFRAAIVDLDDGTVETVALGYSSGNVAQIDAVLGYGSFDVVVQFDPLTSSTDTIVVVRALYSGRVELVEQEVGLGFAWNGGELMVGRSSNGEIVMVEWESGQTARRALILGRETTPRNTAHAGYWLATRDGRFFPFGDAELRPADVEGAVVGASSTGSGGGMWVVLEDGTVVDAGAASWFGDAVMNAGELAVDIAGTPTSMGYWVFTDQGRVLSFGDALHHGDLSGIQLAGPVIAALATPSGDGYYMVASDGGVFAFGDAPFLGSVPQILPGVQLAAPIVGMSPTPDGAGYWLVASDGGVFSFDAPFRGSIPGVLPGVQLNQPVNGMVPYGNGYLLVASDGGVFNFSNLDFDGSLGADPPDSPVAAIAQFSPSL